MDDLAAAVLRTLARVAPQRTPPARIVNLTPAGAVWVGWGGWRPKSFPGPLDLAPSTAMERLAAADALHGNDEEWVLRAGWGVYSGRRDGTWLRTPLLSWPIRLTTWQTTVQEEIHKGGTWSAGGVTVQLPGPQREKILRGARLIPIGDLAVTPLVPDRELADEMAERAVFDAPKAVSSHPSGRLGRWVHEITEAAGLGSPAFGGSHHDPLQARRGVASVTVGLVIYQGGALDPVTRRTSLHAWSRRPRLADTAFSAVYGPGVSGTPGAPVSDVVAGRLELNDAQRRVVLSSRTERVTVVSGAPGCGKTHAVVAVALDAVSRGESVLLVTRSRFAADVLHEMLRQAGDTMAVLFGDSERRRAIADELAQGLAEPTTVAVVDARRSRLRSAVACQGQLERTLDSAVAAELAAGRAAAATHAIMTHQVSAPALFEPAADLDRALIVMRAARRPRAGLLAGWRSRHAQHRMRALAGADPDTALDDLAEAIAAVLDLREAGRLAAVGGTCLGGLRQALSDADAAVRSAAAGLHLAEMGHRRASWEAREVVAALSAALRAGRATRRRALSHMAGNRLTAALPLWVGTLGDVEDLLPPVPAMFDLVVVDEASHVDQPLAAPALLRGRRAVIAGDPRQLRQVSFVSADAMAEAVQREAVGQLRAKLDVSRVSLFDLAAGTAPVRWLSEHHRCAPHLIGFAARKFYAERIALLTTHPRLAARRCIDVELVQGERVSGRNACEVAASLRHVRRRLEAGVRSLGVLSPLREQADALEGALLAEFTLEEINRARLRVGTVHSFQGAECDELVVSFALTDTDSRAAWQFVNDPHLMAVLTTRARLAIHVVTSAHNAPGLVGEYIRHAARPPEPYPDSPPDDEWTAALAAELDQAGFTVRAGYPLGVTSLDLVVGTGPQAQAVETRPHSGGAGAHLERWRTLAAAGWRCHDAYPTRFGYDVTRATAELVGELARHDVHPSR